MSAADKGAYHTTVTGYSLDLREKMGILDSKSLSEISRRHTNGTMSSPLSHIVKNSTPPPPPTRKHILFSNKNISLISKRTLYERKYLEDCLCNCLDTSGKKYHNFLILFSQMAKIHAWNKMK